MQTLTDRIQNGYSGAVYDVMCGRARENRVLPPDLCGLDPHMRVAGPVFTLRGVAFDQQRDANAHFPLPWVKFLAEAQAGLHCPPAEASSMGRGGRTSRSSRTSQELVRCRCRPSF